MVGLVARKHAGDRHAGGPIIDRVEHAHVSCAYPQKRRIIRECRVAVRARVFLEKVDPGYDSLADLGVEAPQVRQRWTLVAQRVHLGIKT